MQGIVNSVNTNRFGGEEGLLGRADDVGGGAQGLPMSGIGGAEDCEGWDG